MSQVGADVYLQLNSWATLVFRNETVASFTSADFQLPATFPVSAAPTGWEIATGNNQTLYGSGVNDQMQDQGYSGVTLVGGKGDDTYVVANSGTTIVELPNQGVDTVEAWASYTLPANVEDLTLEQGGLTGTGNSQANYIIASSTGNNTINGGGGDDMIAAGGGDDTFVFNTTPNTLTNDVTITTFSVANDVFSLSRSVYGALSQGALSSSDFSIGSGATSASDHIIYNSATGALMYDADGSGSGAAVQFAKLSAGLALTASNFSVTA
jgi:Ca2+-binding RTX toxin-like protein